MAIIDLPILQRLRNIKQTSFTFLTYPGALHTRFDHSLGVASACKVFIQHLRAKRIEVSENEEAHVVASALFHDIGHGPFSHLSEECYSFSPDWFKGILASESPDDEDAPLYPKAAPHEALGALLLRTRAAREYLDALSAEYTVSQLDPVVLGDIIAGNGWQGRDHLAVIVNGDLDADEADYIQRDSHFRGLSISLDIGRLGHTLRVVTDDAGERQLALHQSGEVVGNQFLFAKTTLTSSIYHHPKVRAADATFRAVLEKAISAGSDINGTLIENPVRLLELTDGDFFGGGAVSSDPEIPRLLARLSNRDLLYSACEIGTGAVKQSADGSEVSDLWNLRVTKNVWANNSKLRAVRDITRKLIEDYGVTASDSDLWADFPYMVKLSSLPLTDGTTLNRTYASFPGEAWSQQYVKYLYRGYVFAPADHLSSVQTGFTEIARDLYRTSFVDGIGRSLSPYRSV